MTPNAPINVWLARQGRTPESFDAVERLCYAGERGMGALEFTPAIGPRATQTGQVQIDQLALPWIPSGYAVSLVATP